MTDPITTTKVEKEQASRFPKQFRTSLEFAWSRETREQINQIKNGQTSEESSSEENDQEASIEDRFNS